MLQRLLPLAAALVVVGCGNPNAGASKGPAALRKVAPNELRAPADFAGITDTRERSRALFLEASRVLMHPRCVNCHPNGDVPHQGMNMQLHDPPAVRGPDNHGVVGMECTSCHQDRNQELTRVPGAPQWHLAPLEMAWVGKSAREICEQMKDPKRNGGKTLAEIVEHNTHDALVGWGWHPGADREPVPGTQPQFGAIVAAWAETGAECPAEGARP
ncbi:Isoquinoline 1-oxidoreductase subunit [Polyangium spumosum]|uniref:Isoquinoline 1-oxidoreductase subunit n=1 Tax=Polyangium spumosum TaxID=889282 RepID=A0A6N7PEF5_9BACT|nr:Isoquinoline 1-oxidoreductase subunit [Polyangium spumosum]MRG90442.1 Isoquinoline 1-oxidoreductase subunit [Polyangium spumosum]